MRTEEGEEGVIVGKGRMAGVTDRSQFARLGEVLVAACLRLSGSPLSVSAFVPACVSVCACVCLRAPAL